MTNKYKWLYNECLKKNPNATYTRKELKENIKNALSVGRCSVNLYEIKTPQITKWIDNNWYVLPCFHHWYYAVIIAKDNKGRLIAEIQDCLYEGDYHDDILTSQPYDEDLIRANEKLFYEIYNRIAHPQYK